MRHEVGYSPRAKQDLFDLYLYVAEREGDRRALNYSTRIEVFCEKLTLFPERGHRRDDLEEREAVCALRLIDPHAGSW